LWNYQIISDLRLQEYAQYTWTVGVEQGTICLWARDFGVNNMLIINNMLIGKLS